MAMERKNALLAGALIGALLATPVMAAANDACLQHNRIFSMRTLDERTVVATDLSHRSFTIHVNPGCVALRDPSSHLVFRTWQNLGCVGRGDLLGVTAPAMGFITCSISGVDAGAPAGGQGGA
jgi:hypothetical protein